MPEVTGPVLSESRVAELARSPDVEPYGTAPIAFDLFQEGLLLRYRHSPRVIRCLQPPSVAAEEDDRRGSRRIRCRKQQAHGRALRDTEECSVLGADRILVLNDGQIVAQGTHRELLETSPIYREIYASQAETGVLTHGGE